MENIPVLAALLLVAGTVYVVVIEILAIRALREETEAVKVWRPGSVNSPSADRVYRGIRALVERRQAIDPAGLADIASEEAIPVRIGIARFFSQSAVYIGLVGALLGLREAVGLFGNPNVRSSEEVQQFVQRASDVLGNFGNAFWAAIAGVIATVVTQAFLAEIDRLREELARLLEEVAYAKMLEAAGAGSSLDPTFEELRKVSNQLAASIASVVPALNTIQEKLQATAVTAEAIARSSKVSLEGVRDEFRAAQVGLTDALSAGAKELEGAANNAADRLGSATQIGAEVIASAVRDGSQAIHAEIATISESRNVTEESLAETKASLLIVQKQTVAMSEAVQRAALVLEDSGSVQQIVKEAADAARAVPAGIRAEVNDVLTSILQRIDTQTERTNDVLVSLGKRLDELESFFTEIADQAAELPDRITRERLDGLIETAFAPVSARVSEFELQIPELQQLLSSIRAAITTSADSSPTSLLIEQLARIEQRIAMLNTPSTDQAGNADNVHRKLNEILEEVRAPFWQRMRR